MFILDEHLYCQTTVAVGRIDTNQNDYYPAAFLFQFEHVVSASTL